PALRRFLRRSRYRRSPRSRTCRRRESGEPPPRRSRLFRSPATAAGSPSTVRGWLSWLVSATVSLAVQAGRSVNAGEVVEPGENEDGCGLGQRNHEYVPVGLPVGEAGDSKQRDNGAVMRQRVHAAAGHGSDTVKDLERDVCCLGAGKKGVTHGGKGDAQA